MDTKIVFDMHPSHPTVHINFEMLERAEQLEVEAFAWQDMNKLIGMYQFPVRDIEDNYILAAELRRWARATVILYDPLEAAYARGLITVGEWVRLGLWRDLEQCTCTGAEPVACGYCQALGRINEIKGELKDG